MNNNFLINYNFIPVILSGGSGTRLWPLSRSNRPKAYIEFNNKNCLYAQIIQNISSINFVKNIIKVTNKDFFYLSKQSIQSIKFKNHDFILEPFGKNTASSIIQSVLYGQSKFKKKKNIYFVMPSDHFVGKKNFLQDIKKAIRLVIDRDLIFTFGVKPVEPNIGYGYIKEKNNYAKNFFEKPSKEQAEDFIKKGFLWNAGMFMFEGDTFLKEVKKYSQSLLNTNKKCFKQSITKIVSGSPTCIIDSEFFSMVRDISIDHALMEKSNLIGCLPVSFKWSDLGTFSSLETIYKKDKYHNNFKQNELNYIESKNVSIFNDLNKRPTYVIGLDNLAVVDTKDLLLISSRDKIHKSIDIYKKEKRKKNNSLISDHQTVNRPWGSYNNLLINKSFIVKHIIVNSGEKLSLQYHNYRTEHWVIISGKATIIKGNKKITLKENQSIFISKKEVHQLINKEKKLLELIEIQSGTILSEDDIVRMEDPYERF